VRFANISAFKSRGGYFKIIMEADHVRALGNLCCVASKFISSLILNFFYDANKLLPTWDEKYKRD
jgi:hypothetical protein